jgi:alpha-tubulin suppressor-like RCC1 family protein
MKRPHQVTTPAATGWAIVAAGNTYTCATRTDTTLWCWGSNGMGELGIGTTTNQDLPQRVLVPTPTGWSRLAPGFAHTCAIHTGPALWC